MPNVDANDLLELIQSRRTVRKFDSLKPVSQDSLTRILEAGTWAPYAPYYPQGWKFIALRGSLRDEAVKIITKSHSIMKYLRALYESAPYGGEVESEEEHHWKEFAHDFGKNLGGAPVVVVGLVPYDSTVEILGHNLGSAWAAVENMMLQAQAEKLACGVVTIHTPHVVKELIKFLGLNENEWVVAFILNVGHAAEIPQVVPRKAGLFEIRS
ncbi:MAG: nitroreductase family protein [Calditrichaeota bacterium]|nr:MAG: nitroreductase family protein [Calditrichota bacterium]